MSEPRESFVTATGKVATSIVDGLKSQPLLIFLLIFNVIVLGLVAWSGLSRAEREKLILERCLPRTVTLAEEACERSP